jgi:hypothetical protein
MEEGNLYLDKLYEEKKRLEVERDIMKSHLRTQEQFGSI